VQRLGFSFHKLASCPQGPAPLRLPSLALVDPAKWCPFRRGRNTHQFTNTSSEPMRYLIVSTQERPELCVHIDSGKWGVFAPGHAMLQRPAASLDYWEGET
jgi:uncharacterized cupin superfamily protein